MKKINVLPYVIICLLLVLTSCSSEEESVILEESAILNVKSATLNEETAYAYHRMDDEVFCFIDEGFNNWGWSNGPIMQEVIYFDLWAGAGQCDFEKGDRVGRVTMSYNASDNTARIRYILNDNNNYGLDETHLYIGSTKFPLTKKGKETVAPGQYPYKHSDLEGSKTDVYMIDNVPEGFYLIAHAVVSSNE